MKKAFTILLLVLFVFISKGTNYKVLFIGNSYTSVNDLPNLISNVSISAGDTITFSSSTPGGCTFQQHLSQSASLIRQGGWDYVVLQEQSQLPSFPDGQFMNESYPYAHQLCQLIRDFNPNAKIVFYMTWGRKNGDQGNCVNFPPLCTYEGMDSLLNLRYMMMAEDNDAYVSPVGYVWHNIRDNYPNIELYQSDESHPSLIGSYAAACCFYTMFFEKNPQQITFHEGIEESIADIIKNTTRRLVYDSLSKWQFPQHSEDTLSIAQYSAQNFNIFPNPVTEVLNITTPLQLDNTQDVYIYDAKGALVKYESRLYGNQYAISVSDLKSGLYFVQIKSNNQLLGTLKFIK